MMATMSFDPADEWWGGDLVQLSADALSTPPDDLPMDASAPAAPLTDTPVPGGGELLAEDWVLPLLANAPLPVVRLAVACSPRCPSQVLTTLAGDSDPWVRAAVAAHPGTPMGVQVRLTSDPDPEVRRVARCGAE